VVFLSLMRFEYSATYISTNGKCWCCLEFAKGLLFVLLETLGKKQINWLFKDCVVNIFSISLLQTIC